MDVIFQGHSYIDDYDLEGKWAGLVVEDHSALICSKIRPMEKLRMVQKQLNNSFFLSG